MSKMSHAIRTFRIRRVASRSTVAVLVITQLMLYVLYYTKFRYSTHSISQDYQLQQAIKRLYNTSVSAKRQPKFNTPNLDVSKQGCIIPKLNVRDPDIMTFYEEYPPLTCHEPFDWVSLRQGRFSITPEAREEYGNDVNCDLTALVKVTDFYTKELYPVFADVKDGSNLTHDFYKVECTTKYGKRYRNYHANVHPIPEAYRRRPASQSGFPGRGGGVTGLDLDVILIGQDSLSYMAWLRHLPLTRKYIVEDLKAIEMEGQNVVGDGTPPMMFPMLTGKREEELPEARRGFPGAKPLDDAPWIWRDFRQAGYVTSWQEDRPGIGTFHYRLLGFENDPVDHYYRPFGVYTDSQEFEKDCMFSKPRTVVQSEFITDFLDVYKAEGQRRWVLSFKSENSHDNNNKASGVDVHIRDHLKELHQKGHFDNAILIIFSDHGARFSKLRAFAQGKQEERMPYLAIRLPEKFHKKHPDIIKNLRHNSQVLTTPFDLHVTLHEILHYTGSGPADISKRGVSLFKKIPIERDCESAGVDPHWCFCLDWSPVAIDNSVIQQAANYVTGVINEVTNRRRDKCVLLELVEVKDAMEMKMKDDVLKFKDTNDGGRGRFGKMNDGTKQSKIMYQITFVTNPGNGLFEATLSRDLKTMQFSIDLTSISRINQYDMAPWCIMESIPQIRPYCVCKDQPPS